MVVGDSDGIRTWVAMTVWGSKYLGWNNRWIFGYAGTGEMVLALQAGRDRDVGHGQRQAHPRPGAGRRGGSRLVLLTDKRRKDFPDIPTFSEEMLGDKKPSRGIAWQAYKVWAGPSDVDKFIHAPEGTPDNVMSILHSAWAKMVQDPAFPGATPPSSSARPWRTRDGRGYDRSWPWRSPTPPQEVKDFLFNIRKEHGLPTGKKKK